MFLILVGAGLSCRLGAEPTTKPTVVITFPQPGSDLSVGQEVIVQYVAVDARGIARVEFLVNGEPVSSQTVSPASTSYTANQPWTPRAAGRQIIEMRAVNLEEEVSAPAQVVVTVKEAGAAGPGPAAAETPASAAGPVETPGPTAAGSEAGPVVTALVNLNVRSGPGVEYPAVGALLAGESAPITGKNENGTWWQVRYQEDGEPGWVSSSTKYSTSANADGAPLAEAPPPPTPTPTATFTPTPTATPTATPTPRKFVTYGLTANRDMVLLGESVILSWNLRGVEAAYLRYGEAEESVEVPDTRTFYPVQTTTYTLVSRDEETGEETVMAQLTIQVSNATATPVPALRDGKTRIVDGQTLDFDQGIVYETRGSGGDFYWDGQAQRFTPEGGSSVALLKADFAEITLDDCRLASYRETIPPTGGAGQAAGCYRTGERRFGKFAVSEGDEAGNLTVEWLTWDYR